MQARWTFTAGEGSGDGRAAGHGIRVGATKKPQLCWVFHFGHAHFNSCRVHQVQNADTSGAPERLGPGASSALHYASVLVRSNEAKVGKVCQVRQALEFLGDDGGEQAIQGNPQLLGLSFGQALH